MPIPIKSFQKYRHSFQKCSNQSKEKKLIEFCFFCIVNTYQAAIIFCNIFNIYNFIIFYKITNFEISQLKHNKKCNFAFFDIDVLQYLSKN